LSWAIVSAAFSIGLITLFIGDLTRRRAHILFWITYIMSFMSLAVPIWAIIAVSTSQYAVEMMEQAPTGLIKGTARGVQRPQWLVNVGGAVVPPKEVETKEETAPQKDGPAPQQSSTPQENIGTMELRPTPGFAMVQGGLAVPFYVIILAMLGAGINMTKKVPGIQQTYNLNSLRPDSDSVAGAVFRTPMALVPSPSQDSIDEERAKTMLGIRKDLIDIYVGLISAPFLAIAVYYLLQVIATNIAEPVLVLVSFAVGFTSDSIVAAITTFASNMVSKLSPESSTGTAEKK
jgi:hypothetical protein